MKLHPILTFAFASALFAQEQAAWSVPLRDLIPADKIGNGWARSERIALAMWPRVVLETKGEAVIRLEDSPSSWRGSRQAIESGTLLVRAESGKPVKGRVLVPDSDYSTLVAVPFELKAESGKVGTSLEAEFAAAEVEYLEEVLRAGVPGGAWFRRRHAELCKKFSLDEAARRVPLRRNEETFDMFSGGHALAENLQLDRGLAVVQGGESTVDVTTIQGVKVKEIDWSKRLSKQPPALDPLAKLVPYDQHAVFLPSFAALIRLSDEADKNGTPVLQAMEPRGEDARVAQRYERQLCLSTSGLGRLLGPHLVQSVAITGADPYLRVGADVAIIFEPKDASSLEKLLVLQTRSLAQSDPLAKPTEGKVGEISWSGVRSPDRRICSHVARIGDAVVVTNSEAQLAKIVAAAKKKAKCLADLDEYVFFRTRYPRAEESETALAVLSDATIRRWCSAKWRIADSRRTRALAVLADLNCEHVKVVATASDEVRPLPEETASHGLGALSISRGGTTSELYGSMEFATPILELDLAKVTAEEKAAYETWREQYERYWRGFFDPIAFRVGISDKKLTGDLTVMPLIGGSEYRDWIEITRGVEIRAETVDLHDSLGTFAIAINREARDVRQIVGFLAGFSARNDKAIDPLGWLGTTFSIHADRDPFWDELSAANKPSEFLEKNWTRLPFLVQIESTSALKLTGFLAALRSAIEGTAPGMTTFTTRDHQGQGYVRIGASEEAQKEMRDFEHLAVYYAASGDALLLTLNENVMKRAVERRAARRAARAESRALPQEGTPLLGKSVSLQAKPGMLEPWRLASGELQRDQLRGLCWSNLPILEVWHRIFPNEDPVSVHERLFATRLMDPSGGVYVWNPKLLCMESTVLGCPSAPKPGPDGFAHLADYTAGNFGITFEDDGLRGRIEIDRK